MDQADLLSEVVGLVGLLGMLTVSAMLLVRRVDDPFGLFFLTFGVYYCVRAVVIALGLDVPIPEYLFAATDAGSVVLKTDLALCLFLLAFTVAAVLATRTPARKPGMLFYDGPPPTRQLMVLTILLTAVSAAISVWLLSTYGGFGGVVKASKVTQDLAGLRFLKVPSSVGAMIGTAAFLDLRAKPSKERFLASIALGCAVLNSVLVFAWGQRTVVLIVAAMIVLSPGRRRTTQRHSRLTRVVAASLIVVGAAVFLRDTRDTFTQGNEPSEFAQSSLARRASQGTNGVYYDASLLAFRDWPGRFEYRNGKDFAYGFLGSVPRKLWPEKPDPLPGKWFRQTYQPQVRNGWPVGAPTIWYMNFGWAGIIVGGVISGVVVGAVAKRYRLAPHHGINTAVTFFAMVFVFPLGFSSQSPLAWLTWGLPLLLCIGYLNFTTAKARRAQQVRLPAEEMDYRPS